ncbi:hypothetical protein LCGC14_1425400 [marine sediment metagenome]|uniref:Uncharacterized protein n=1 Tax=marine sediment metagenome TaxID=412755 RepID=A0A0F9JQ17_9ZZZZ
MKKLLIILLLIVACNSVVAEDFCIGDKVTENRYYNHGIGKITKIMTKPNCPIIDSVLSYPLYYVEYENGYTMWYNASELMHSYGGDIIMTEDILECENFMIETVFDRIWRNTGHTVYRDDTEYQQFQRPIRHYLKLRINGETYRIELIKESE